MHKPLISWRPFTHMQSAPPPIEIVAAKNAWLMARDGNRYLDAISSWWTITHGHCHPHMIKAITKTANSMDQIVFANFTHAPAQNLLEKLAAMLPVSLRAAFFSDNGSTSIEVALKMALQYWQLLGQQHRNKIVALEGAYHGDTAGCMSVSARGLFTNPFKKMLMEVIRFDDAVASLTDDTAAIIIEPLVQGAGGMIMWDREILLGIIRAARAKNIVVIFDEVMTGFYRTGHRFAFEALGEVPDILCLSKGLTGGFLPLALTICQQHIYDAFLDDDRGRMFFHGHTFTGNPVSCASAVANLELMDSDFEDKIKRIENHHRTRLSAIASPLIKDKRMQGTIAAIELHDDDIDNGYLATRTAQIYSRALKLGVFLRPIGNVIYVMPPFGILDDELAKIWDAVEKIIAELATH